MLCKIQRKKLSRHLLTGGALLAAGFGMFSCSDTYDLDTEQPSGLNSIYGYMKEQGEFTTTLQLIDDLGETEVLSKTGSKTMFVANDAAFAEFFKSNSWGVKSYAELTKTQKKLLLYSAMIDNPYSTSMLSTAEGPVKGEVCRRSSSLTLYDSVLVVNSKSAEAKDILPDNDRFAALCANHDSVVLYCDASTSAPMVHFNYKFLASNKVESSDVDFLYNQKAGERNNDDVYVNNSKVVDANIFCKNGFIHKVDRVIMPLDNMAEIIRKDPDTQIFSKIIERFAAVDYKSSLTDAYNVNKGTDYDSVFIKRYYSDRSDGSDREDDEPFSLDKDNMSFDASLKFDPGWNGYMPLSGDPRDAMMEDMAVMLVPTDQAMREWEQGTGKPIIDFYKSIEATPNSTIDDLVRVNQLASLVNSVPSRFNDVLNDANEPLGITKEDIVSVTLGCNGVIYKTNKVFTPTSYSSVLFPAVVDTSQFKIIETAISCLDYDKYLNSMVSKYVFLIPTNDGLLTYIDPVSYGQTTSQLWEFHYDASKEKNKRIIADVCKCELNSTTGSWEKQGDAVYHIKNVSCTDKNGVLYDRLENLLDNIIVTTGYQNGQEYYKTKGNTFVRIEGVEVGNNVYGSFQYERDTPLRVKKTYSMRNGHALVLDGAIMGTRKSTAMVLDERPEFSDFLSIMQASGIINSNNPNDYWDAVANKENLSNVISIIPYGRPGAEDKSKTTSKEDKVTAIFNNFHYTVYAPTNEAMQEAFRLGLPTLEMLEEAENRDEYNKDSLNAITYCADSIKSIMQDFVRYHMQDNSLYVDNGFQSGQYESSKSELIKSIQTAEAVNINDTTVYKIDPVTRKAYYYYKNKWCQVIKSWKNENDDVVISYYPGTYSPGRPYRLNVEVSDNGMTITDVSGRKHNVLMDENLHNIQAAEYWVTYKPTEGSAQKKFGNASTPYEFFLNNSSSIVIHGIDSPLIYSDGTMKDENGFLIPSQFEYLYRPLHSEN